MSGPSADPPSSQPTPQRITQFAWGFAPPLMIHAAVENGIFDALDGGARTVDEVAARSGAAARGVRALMDGLVGLELLQREGDRYSLAADAATYLVCGKQGFLGGLVRHTTGQIIERWLKLPEIVRSGKPLRAANQNEHGAEFFAQFVEDLFNLNYPGAKKVAEELAAEWKGNGTIKALDVAAGSGVWGIALAERSPAVHVTALDWPQVLPIARRIAKQRGVADRFETVEGDLNDVDFGSGYHVVTLGHILHSEGEAQSRKLLKKVFDALAPGGTVVIAEYMPNDDRLGPPQALIFAVNMLINTEHGGTFTAAELSGWLREIGFEQPRLLEIPGPSPLLLARKPKAVR